MADDKPVENRVQSHKGDSLEQQRLTAYLRARLGLEEHPEWSDAKIADEYGTLVDLVRDLRD